MGNTTRHGTRKNKKDLQEALKKKDEEFFARSGNTTGEAGRDKRAKNIAERRDYRALERRHDGAARARDEAVAKCAAKTEARQSAESLAKERKLSMETEERPRLDTAARLSGQRQQPPHAEADTREALAALEPRRGGGGQRLRERRGCRRRWIPTFHLLLLPLLRSLLLLLILPFYIHTKVFVCFLILGLLKYFRLLSFRKK